MAVFSEEKELNLFLIFGILIFWIVLVVFLNLLCCRWWSRKSGDPKIVKEELFIRPLAKENDPENPKIKEEPIILESEECEHKGRFKLPPIPSLQRDQFIVEDFDMEEIDISPQVKKTKVSRNNVKFQITELPSSSTQNKSRNKNELILPPESLDIASKVF